MLQTDQEDTIVKTKNICSHCDNFDPVVSAISLFILMLFVGLCGEEVHFARAADKGSGAESDRGVRPGTGKSSLPKGSGAQIESCPTKGCSSSEKNSKK